MSGLRVIADDVTGACDVGSEFAAEGHVVRVVVDARGSAGRSGDLATELAVTNTQSRSLTAAEAAGRVGEALAQSTPQILLKKIDTALRGHLGAELAAAVEGSGASGAFVIPAIPAVGRVTRAGQQWVRGQLLGATEFARDPEGKGAESSVAAVLAHECDWSCEVVDVDTVRAGQLGGRARTLFDTGCRLIIVDAETDADVEHAVASMLTLPRPLCLAGSIPLARALARRDDLQAAAHPDPAPTTLRSPSLIVCGSLHSRAHAQTEALVAADLATRELVDDRSVDGLVAQIRAHLDRGRNVILEAPPVEGSPAVEALRRIEHTLREVVRGVAVAGPVGSLVLIGGETSYGVLQGISATELLVLGRPAPLVALAEIATGIAAGTLLVTKGGSGGDVGALTTLIAAGR